MLYDPSEKVIVHTPAALLVGVVTLVRVTHSMKGEETKYHIAYLDNVAGPAEMVCNEEDLATINSWESNIVRWLEGKGKAADDYCTGLIAELKASIIPPKAVEEAAQVAA